MKRTWSARLVAELRSLGAKARELEAGVDEVLTKLLSSERTTMRAV